MNATKCKELQFGGDKCDKHFVLDPVCKLETWFWAVQPLLVVVVCLAVVAKRWIYPWPGRPNERNVVWALDTAKQAASAVTMLLGAGLGASHLQWVAKEKYDMATNEEYGVATNECAWFAVIYLANATLGTIMAYVLLFRVCKHKNSGRYSTKRTGVNYHLWVKQFTLWILVSAVARGLIHLLLWSSLHMWSDHSQQRGGDPELRHREYTNPVLTLVGTLAQAFACHRTGFEYTVMVCCPLMMGAFTACVQDSMLMDKHPPAARLSSAADGGIGAELLRADNMAEMYSRYTASDEDGSDEDDVANVDTSPKSYKARRKACVKGCCGCLVLSVLLVLWTGVLFKVQSGQQVFDPCYVHVRAEYPGDYQTPDQPHPTCQPAEPMEDKKHNIKQTFRYMIEHRQDLVNTSGTTWMPMCKCCVARTPSNLSRPCTQKDRTTGVMDCPGLGECCARSSLHHPMRDLMKTCSICKTYKPCDQQRCPARPDNIRNSQHLPMLLGVLVSFVGNCQVLFSFSFNKALQQRSITTLLACAAAVELVYCVCFMSQELAFRIPADACILSASSSEDGKIDSTDCPPLSAYTGWPTWAQVKAANQAAVDGDMAGDRGAAVNNCAIMSVLFQLTWTATDSFFFMITVDLLLNLLTSPFGSTRKRWLFYHGWTWGVSIFFAVWLYVSGDWGISFDSILEDFCWHRNFGSKNGTATNGADEHQTGSYVYVLSLLYNLIALLVSLYSHQKVRTLTEGQRKVREAVIKEGIMVTVVCALWWVVLFGIVYQLVLDKTPDIINTTRMELGPIDYSTVWDRFWVVLWAFIVGGRNAITPLVWQLVVWKVGQGRADDANAKELTAILQNELLFFTGLGIRHAVRNASPGGYSRASASSSMDDEIFEVPLETAAVYEKAHETAFFRSFQPVFLRGQDQDPADFPQELTRQMKQFKFKSYEPQKFAELRRLFDTNTGNSGLPSLQSNAGGNEDCHDLLHAAMEHYEPGNFSGGASGAFMYFSADKRYIVKQMSEGEKTVLLDMLNDYLDYMRENPDSLLLRVVQCNQIQMYQGCSNVPVLKKCLKGRLYFMVFENLNFGALQETMAEIRHVMSPPDRQTDAGVVETEAQNEMELRAEAGKELKKSMLQYDLKGSWVNRTTITRGPPAQSGAVGTLKDGDLHEQLYLPKEQRNAMIVQLRKDTEFLKEREIMDYSLLLGIKKRLMPLTHTERRKTGSPTYFPNQGKAAASYHIGIIDILQKWNRAKKMERYAKLLLGKDIDGLSAIDAESFQDRFMKAMENHFPELDVEEEDDDESYEHEEDEDKDNISATSDRSTTNDGPADETFGVRRSSSGLRRMGSRPRLSSGNLLSNEHTSHRSSRP